MSAKRYVTLGKIISSNLRALRKIKHAGSGGQQKCAKEFGVTQSEWSMWENNRRTPSDETQQRLAEFFGITVEDLLSDSLHVDQQKKVPADEAGTGVSPKVLEACNVLADLQIELLRIQQKALAGAVSEDDFVGLVTAVVQASKKYAQTRSTLSLHVGA